MPVLRREGLAPARPVSMLTGAGNTPSQASHGFILKKSKIEGAGQGLFASKRIPPNTKIADYGGVLKTKEAYDRNPSGYGIEVNRVNGVRMVRDSASTQSGYGRWANDGGATPTQG